MGGPGLPAAAAAAALRSLALLALPGALLLDKYSQYRHRHMESARRRLTERELLTLNTKIDKLLNTLEQGDAELATSQEDECVICVNAKATMQTSPCGHRVVCRRCFVKTIQMAVSQRLLPLRCVICRAKILRLRHAAGAGGGGGGRLVSSRSWGGACAAPGPPQLPASASCYSVGARSVPASASLYSVASGESSLSGVSSVSSASGISGAAVAGRGASGGKPCAGACHGAVPRVPPAPTGSRHHTASQINPLRTQRHTHKEYAPLASYTGAAAGGGQGGGDGGRLPPIREFQREFREGQREPSAARPARPADTPAPASASSRIRCAQKIVSQLESSPQKTRGLFRTPLRALDNGASGDTKSAAAGQRETKSAAAGQRETKSAAAGQRETKSAAAGQRESKKAAAERRRAEAAAEAERRREEKAQQKAEKEARRRAKEEDRQAKQRAREEERRAKQLARELKRQTKKDAKKAAS